MPSIPDPRGDHQNGDAASREGADRGTDAPTPVLDPSVLRDMERDFSDSGVVARFARDFSVSLGDKIDRLDHRMRDGDALGASDAALSLIISADMIGAGQLGAAARAALDSLAGADATTRTAIIEGLRTCASDTLTELALTYPDDA
jgi:hypothetical protein